MRISDWSSDVCSSDLAAAAPAKDKRKLGFKQARELEQLPARIEALEMRIAELTAAMNDPAFYQRDSAAINAHNAVVAEAQAELDPAYARWRSEEHTSELQSLMRISYASFCLTKKTTVNEYYINYIN